MKREWSARANSTTHAKEAQGGRGGQRSSRIKTDVPTTFGNTEGSGEHFNRCVSVEWICNQIFLVERMVALELCGKGLCCWGHRPQTYSKGNGGNSVRESISLDYLKHLIPFQSMTLVGKDKTCESTNCDHWMNLKLCKLSKRKSCLVNHSLICLYGGNIRTRDVYPTCGYCWLKNIPWIELGTHICGFLFPQERRVSFFPLCFSTWENWPKNEQLMIFWPDSCWAVGTSGKEEHARDICWVPVTCQAILRHNFP